MSVVSPAFNEARNLPAVYEKIRSLGETAIRCLGPLEGLKGLRKLGLFELVKVVSKGSG